jgi:hypothetical protein
MKGVGLVGCGAAPPRRRANLRAPDSIGHDLTTGDEGSR